MSVGRLEGGRGLVVESKIVLLKVVRVGRWLEVRIVLAIASRILCS